MLEEGVTVHYVAFTTSPESNPPGFGPDAMRPEAQKATALLGIPKENVRLLHYKVRRLNFDRQEILEDMVKLRKELNPDIVFVPASGDVHQDHQVITAEALRTFKTKIVLGFELIWNNLDISNRFFIRVEERHVEAKYQACQQYVSQGHRDYMSREFIFGLAKARGVQVQLPYAESFELIRFIAQ